MIIFDSDKNKDWAGKGVVVQHGSLLLLKDANFYHDVDFNPGKHVVEVFGRKRTGQPLLNIELLDSDIKVISQFSADFSETFSCSFEFEINKKSKGYIRLYRPGRNSGTIDIVKVVIKNTSLNKEEFLKNDQRSEEGRSIIAGSNKKNRIEIIKEERQSAKILQEDVEEENVNRRGRRNKNPDRNIVAELTKEVVQQITKEVVQQIAKDIPRIPQESLVKNSNAEARPRNSPTEKVKVSEEISPRNRAREDRLAARFNKIRVPEVTESNLDSKQAGISNLLNPVKTAEQESPKPLAQKDLARNAREARRAEIKNIKSEMAQRNLEEREMAKAKAKLSESSRAILNNTLTPNNLNDSSNTPSEGVMPPVEQPIPSQKLSSKDLLKLSRISGSIKKSEEKVENSTEESAAIKTPESAE